MINMMMNMPLPDKMAENMGAVSDTQSPPPMTLTVEDLQRELHISRNTAYELTEQKGFPVFRVGKRKLINRQKLQEWMDAQCTEAA